MDQKTSVDVLITAEFVLTMDDRYTIYTPGAVAVRGDSIVAVGPLEDLVAVYEGKERVDTNNSVLLPGFVNTHGHAPMTLLRALADDLRLDVWLMGYMMPVERAFVNPHFCWLGTQLAAAEMIRSGTTTFMDMYYFEEAVADAAVQAGMRGVCLQSVLKFPAPDAGSFEEGLARARDYVMRWKDHPLIVPGIAPHAPYTVTPELLKGAVAIALEFDVPLHIHVAETKQEVEDHRKAFGMPPVPWLKKFDVLKTKATIAHGVHLDEGEMRTLQHYNVGVAHNPSSNLKLASGIAPVAKMLELGLNVGIGTDGPASNNDLDMIEELRLAALVAKVATMDPTTLPARQVLAMATIMGARAMHIGDLVGSLEAGKRADLISLSLEATRHTPYFRRDLDNIYSRIVYAAHQEDVQDVMVNGRWLMRHRTLLTVNEQALREEADALARKIDVFLMRREESVLSKLVAIGGVAEGENFEVQVKVRDVDVAALEAQILEMPEITISRGSSRVQYDTYFIFDDPWGSRLRYREDEVRALDGSKLFDVITRLTLTASDKEREYESAVLLSRSRFDAPATRSLRFYREYFKPQREIEIHKRRRRYHVRYGDTDLALNFDTLIKPENGGSFFEVKSRTWSRQDAEHKAALIGELLKKLGIIEDKLVTGEYVDLA